jgi:pilus assembly protein CpaF
MGPDGRVVGEFVPTGVRPWFMQKFKVSGFDIPAHIFERG